MKVMIFNDTQNFNGSLNFLNSKFDVKSKRFWNYKKYIPLLIKKIKSLEDFNNPSLELKKVFFYEGKYSNKIMKNFNWSCNQEISKINQMVKREHNLLNLVSQSQCSKMLRNKVNKHVEETKKQLEEKKKDYIHYKQKQEKQFEGQKDFFEELKNNPLIEIRYTPLKQHLGEVHQKGVDVLLATDLVHLAHMEAYDIAIILSGDTDLIEAVKLIKSLGKIPIIISYHTPGNPLKSNISDLMTAGKFLNLRTNFSDQEILDMSDLKETK